MKNNQDEPKEENILDSNESEDNQQNLNENDSQEVSETDELKSKLEAAEKVSKDYLDRLQRSVAEFDNFRKRTISEKAGMYDNGVRDTIEKLLPVVDNFERAVETAANKEDSFFTGVEMILKQMKEFLNTVGVEEINCVGETFDPNLHNAVMHSEDENYGQNVVAEQLQKGYIYKDKVIRHSMVKVVN